VYILDTNICIYLMKGNDPSLLDRVEEEGMPGLALSSVTVAELEYGVAKSLYPDKNRLRLYGFLAPFEIISFDGQDDESFGMIRTFLERRGTPIGPYDLQIAAQCLARDFCLVTNNVREFERIPGLRIENWTGG